MILFFCVALFIFIFFFIHIFRCLIGRFLDLRACRHLQYQVFSSVSGFRAAVSVSVSPPALHGPLRQFRLATFCFLSPEGVRHGPNREGRRSGNRRTAPQLRGKIRDFVCHLWAGTLIGPEAIQSVQQQSTVQVAATSVPVYGPARSQLLALELV